MHAACETSLASVLAGDPGTTAENVQARLRCLVLMAFVNRRGGILLNTSNKTELALGYGTLYGDLAGGLAVIADLTKTEVYSLARHYDRSRGGGVTPPFVLERPPSAELKPDQVDPFDYPHISPLTEPLIDGSPLEALVQAGTTPEEVARLDSIVRSTEHKRRQGAIALKVSRTSFGPGRLLPVTNRYVRGRIELEATGRGGGR